MAKRNRKTVDPKIGEDGLPLTADRKKELAGYVNELERLAAQKKEIGEQEKLIKESARDAGFDGKALTQTIKMRTWEREKLKRHETIVDVYRHALGDLADLPLGQSAIDRATH